MELPTCQSGLIAKHVPHLLDSFSAREPGAQNLLQHAGMKATHTLLTVAFITPVPQFWFVIPNHQKTEKSGDVLHLSGRFEPRHYKNIFPESDDKSDLEVPALDVRAQILSVHDRRNGVGKTLDKPALLGHEQNSVSLLLICAKLTFLMTCYVNWLVKQAIRLRIARPMCDGCSLTSSLFCRIAGRGLFSLYGVPLCWLLRLSLQNLYMYQCFVIVKSLKPSGSRPYGAWPLFCGPPCEERVNPYWHKQSAPMSQFLFVTESCLSAPRLVCPWDPCPSSGRWLNQEDLSSMSTHCHKKMQTVILLETLILVLHINSGDAMLSNSPEVLRDQPTRDTCVHIPTGGLWFVSRNTRGLLGSTASSQRSREQKYIYLTRFTRNNDINLSSRNAVTHVTTCNGVITL